MSTSDDVRQARRDIDCELMAGCVIINDFIMLCDGVECDHLIVMLAKDYS